jgi:hypothetical protein
MLFTGDAAKNRAELVSGHVDSSEDFAASEATVKAIWSVWREVPGTILIPGHDLSMRLDAGGRPEFIGERKAAIAAWFGEALELTTTIDLAAAAKETVRAR